MVASNLPFDEWTEVFGSERLIGRLDRLTHHVHIAGDERRQLPSQPEPKNAETPKNLTTQPMVDPVGPQGTSHAASLRVTQALHEAARVPPMDYRDNAQRWAESHQVVHFYAGQWCTFTPAFDTRPCRQGKRGCGEDLATAGSGAGRSPIANSENRESTVALPVEGRVACLKTHKKTPMYGLISTHYVSHWKQR